MSELVGAETVRNVVVGALTLALGVVVAVVSPMLALLLAGIALLVAIGLRVDARLLTVVPVILLVAAPWQRLLPFEGKTVLFPVFWAAGVVLLVRIGRMGVAALRLDSVALVGVGVMAWAGLGVLAGHGTVQALMRWSLLWGSGILLYWVLANRPTVILLLRSARPLLMLLSGYALLEWAIRQNILFGTLIPTFVEDTFRLAGTYRSTGTLGHPLVLADVLSILLVLTVMRLAASSKFGSVDLVAVAVGGLGLAVTGARGAMLLTLGSCVIALSQSTLGVKGWLRVLLVAVAVSALVGGVAGAMIESRFSDSLSSLSFQQRLVSLEVAVEVVADSPLFGTGVGSGYDALASRGHRVAIPETEYAGRAIALGLPGLALILALPFVALLAGDHTGGRRRSLPLVLVLLGLIGTHNYFDWWGGASLYFAVCALIGGLSADMSGNQFRKVS